MNVTLQTRFNVPLAAIGQLYGLASMSADAVGGVIFAIMLIVLSVMIANSSQV